MGNILRLFMHPEGLRPLETLLPADHQTEDILRNLAHSPTG